MRNVRPTGVANVSNPRRKGADLDAGPLYGPSPAEPWPLYRELREMGPVVWLEKYGMFALTRYDVVRALRDWEAFPSSFGVMMNDDMNQIFRGNPLCSDGDAHHRLRRVVIRPLTPAALSSLSEELEHEAEAVVDRLCGKGRFCATREFATHLPVTIVSNAIGLPEEGRERMMEWSIGLFNCIGPMNDRARNAMPVLSEMMHYARTHAVPGQAEARKLGRGDPSCRRRRRGAVRGSAGPDDRLYGTQSRHDHLWHLQRRVAVRQLPRSVGSGAQ